MIGPGREPGLVRTLKAMASMPDGPAFSASLWISTMNSARSSLSAGSSAITALVSACAVSCRRTDSCLAASMKASRVSPTRASIIASRSSPASRSPRSATIWAASSGKASTVTLYLRAAPRSANSRSSVSSRSRGLKSADLSAVSTAVCASASALSTASSAATVSFSSSGASWALRSSRRIRPLITGIGEPWPLSTSLASLMSLAVFSAFIISERRSARSSSSPSTGWSFSSSSTEARRKSASRRAASTLARWDLSAPLRLAPGLMQTPGIGCARSQAAEGVEQRPVRIGLHQRPVVVLAVDLDKAEPRLAHQRHACRLIIEKHPCPAIGRLHTAEHQVAIVVDAVVTQQESRRVIGRDIETPRSPGPCRRHGAQGCHRRGRRVPATENQEEWICPHRSPR